MAAGFNLVETQGLEPRTSRMWSERSNQLSYASEKEKTVGFMEPPVFSFGEDEWTWTTDPLHVKQVL